MSVGGALSCQAPRQRYLARIPRHPPHGTLPRTALAPQQLNECLIASWTKGRGLVETLLFSRALRDSARVRWSSFGEAVRRCSSLCCHSAPAQCAWGGVSGQMLKGTCLPRLWRSPEGATCLVMTGLAVSRQTHSPTNLRARSLVSTAHTQHSPANVTNWLNQV